MTEEEKKIFTECLVDSIRCATDTVYETMAMLFETIANARVNGRPPTLEEALLTMSQGLRMLVDKKENKK